MFSKVLLVTLLSSALATAIKPINAGSPKPSPEPISQCNTGGAQCCKSSAKATDPEVTNILHSLDVVVEGVDVLVGLTCTPIAVLGTAPNCAQKPLCCENNSFNGLINIGCTPISL